MSMTERQADHWPSPRPHPARVRVAHMIEDFIDEINWLHIAFKICAYAYITFIAWITWQVLPLPGHWTIDPRLDMSPQLSQTYQSLNNYFESFNGYPTCSIHAADLYSEHLSSYSAADVSHNFCSNRRVLLQAMSNGGRIGFDTPYISRDCQYKWFTTSEICMILDRFDSLIFVGDDILQSVYNGFNILLRQNLASGALQTWSMSTDARAGCQCENQFIKTDCAQYFVTSSGQVSKNSRSETLNSASGFTCDRTAHAFLRVEVGSPKQTTVNTFEQMLSKRSESKYKPIPVIHSLSPMTMSQSEASISLSEFSKLGSLSTRKTPMLWIGPNAAGHVEIRGRKSNQEIWNFDAALARTAHELDIEVLQMWNMTVQASSWDGVKYGEKVALVQAMMVVNWLSRLESS